MLVFIKESSVVVEIWLIYGADQTVKKSDLNREKNASNADSKLTKGHGRTTKPRTIPSESVSIRVVIKQVFFELNCMCCLK